MLDIKVETFLTVCKVLNFTKAAKILNITQPAVSMHIKHLEEYYHAPLFQFEGKHFHLTKYGQLLYESLSSMRNNEKQLKDQLRIIKSRNNIINMGATLTVGEFMISRPIGRYLQENPDTEVTVTVSNTKELLAKLDLGQIDFAILEGDFPKSTYAHQPLFQLEFIPICAPDHLPFPGPLTLESLLTQRLILREPGSGTRKILEQALEAHSLSVSSFEKITTIGNMNAIINLVSDNCGITFLYKRAVEDLLLKKSLVEIPIEGFSVFHDISAVWKKENLHQDYIQSLLNQLFPPTC